MPLKKRIMSALAALLLLLPLAACGAGTPESTKGNLPSAPEAESSSSEAPRETAAVYFTSDISAEGLVKIYESSAGSRAGRSRSRSRRASRPRATISVRN